MTPPLRCTFTAIEEDQAGPQWQALFQRHWPQYQGWYLGAGVTERPTFLQCRKALRTYMPRWIPVWERLTELAGGGDIQARFLSMWNPPAYIGGCAQGIWRAPRTASSPSAPALLRNYDYAPELLEGAWLSTRWAQQHVLCMSDCLTGALDGINESGLALSLSYGGRRVLGAGFGIPLVLRYVLEFAKDVPEACELLARLPLHMSYTVSLLDAQGRQATAFLSPDRGYELSQVNVVTNHQHAIEWPEHANATSTLARAQALENDLRQATTLEQAMQSLLKPPLFQSAYRRGYGTLYSACYVPAERSATLAWLDGHSWEQRISAFKPGQREVAYTDIAAQI